MSAVPRPELLLPTRGESETVLVSYDGYGAKRTVEMLPLYFDGFAMAELWTETRINPKGVLTDRKTYLGNVTVHDCIDDNYTA